MAVLLVLLVAATWPAVWLVPGLAILEELSHGLGYNLVGVPWLPTVATFLAHWSHAYVGFPLMPWITFPIVTLAGILLARHFHRPPVPA